MSTFEVGVVGGTGSLGGGLVAALAAGCRERRGIAIFPPKFHGLMVGSRDADRAHDKLQRWLSTGQVGRVSGLEIAGVSNVNAINSGNVVFFCPNLDALQVEVGRENGFIDFTGGSPVLVGVSAETWEPNCEVVIQTMVPIEIRRVDGKLKADHVPLPGGTAYGIVRQLVPEETPVLSSLLTIPAAALQPGKRHHNYIVVNLLVGGEEGDSAVTQAEHTLEALRVSCGVVTVTTPLISPEEYEMLATNLIVTGISRGLKHLSLIVAGAKPTGDEHPVSAEVVPTEEMYWHLVERLRAELKRDNAWVALAPLG